MYNYTRVYTYLYLYMYNTYEYCDDKVVVSVQLYKKWGDSPKFASSSKAVNSGRNIYLTLAQTI